MLKDKIYKYLKTGTFKDLKLVAKDLGEICEKFYNRHIELSKEILQDNTLLKSKLDNITYLDRQEVEKIFEEELPEPYNYIETKFIYMADEQNIINNICKLAIPKIDKDKIVEVLKRLEINKTIEEWYRFTYKNAKVSLDFKGAADECIKTIADEIIKDGE